MYKVYLLYSVSSGKTYSGQTSDLIKRLKYHNHGEEINFTAKYRPWELMYSETYETRSEAMKREKWFKTGVGRERIKIIRDEYLLKRSGMESAAADGSSGS